MTHHILSLIGFYLAVIGTWRLANATQQKPIGNFMQKADKDNSYNPLKDLVSPHKVIIWFFQTMRSIHATGTLTDCVILHKQFNWGLWWLLLGIAIQYIAGFF